MNAPLAGVPSRVRLSQEEFQSMRRDAQVLSQDEHGEKVLLTADRKIIKLFRRKRLLSSALFDPYANRFARASVRLMRLEIMCPRVESIYRIPSIQRDAVVYERLDGVELRNRADDLTLGQLPDFMAALHHKGVYFRAAHFGNILIGPNGSLGLIDVSETRFYRGPLSPSLRARNFKPLTSYEVDREGLLRFGLGRFISTYLEHARLDDRSRTAFLGRLAAVRPIFHDAATALLQPSA